MKKNCPNPKCTFPNYTVKDGTYRRKDDSKVIQRFRCRNCSTRFSQATFSEAFGHKKRRINFWLLKLLSSGVSMRRSAILLNVDKRTVARKLPYLASRCRRKNEISLNKIKGRVHNVQIDDLITKENSKLKPLSISLAVDENRRTILAAEVSQIPAFGHLSQLAAKKYGTREDKLNEGLQRMFTKLSRLAVAEVIIKSDEHLRYPRFISCYLPRAKHLTFKGEKGCVVGQGELKKLHNDPLFIVNHTCALLRANINRLIRKTWCTTKRPERLKDHLDIFIYFFNQKLLGPALTPL